MPTTRMTAACIGFALAGTGITAAPAQRAAQAEPSYHAQLFAAGTDSLSGPDDLAHLGRDVFVGWQNGVGSMGEPSSTGNTDSTVIEYRPDGTVLGQWSVVGKVDGMGADPANHRIIATVNEDGNTSLYTITPANPPASQVTHYQYQPANPLPHGGGTDSVTVMAGRILIAASAPSGTDGPAVYEADLSGGTATLTPVFSDNSSATVANTDAADHGQEVQLALTDPDSTTRVPSNSPRFAGDFLLDSQGDQEQIYVSDPGGSHQRLSLLRLDQSVDDTAFATTENGTLYVTDGHSVFAVTGDFRPGTAFTAVTPGNANNAPPNPLPNYLAQLDLATGHTTPALNRIQAKGLIFVGPAQHQGDNSQQQGDNSQHG